MTMNKEDLLIINRALLCYRSDQTEIIVGKSLTDKVKQNYQNITKVMNKVEQLFEEVNNND